MPFFKKTKQNWNEAVSSVSSSIVLTRTQRGAETCNKITHIFLLPAVTKPSKQIHTVGVLLLPAVLHFTKGDTAFPSRKEGEKKNHTTNVKKRM